MASKPWSRRPERLLKLRVILLCSRFDDLNMASDGSSSSLFTKNRPDKMSRGAPSAHANVKTLLSVCATAALVCCKEATRASLRGAKGLLIHEQMQRDRFLPHTVYCQLPFDLCQAWCRAGRDATLAYAP